MSTRTSRTGPHIEIHLFLDGFPTQSHLWGLELDELMYRVHDYLRTATINAKSHVLGKTTLLDNETNVIRATIDIRKQP